MTSVQTALKRCIGLTSNMPQTIMASIRLVNSEVHQSGVNILETSTLAG
jgi:hypothetical protein